MMKTRFLSATAGLAGLILAGSTPSTDLSPTNFSTANLSPHTALIERARYTTGGQHEIEFV
jgi:hypothetical protein